MPEREKLPKGLYKRGHTYWVRYAGLDGKIIFESSKSTKIKDAMDILHKRKAEVLSGIQPEIKKKIPNTTFKELSVEYLKWAERQRSFKKKKLLVDQLVKIFGKYPLRIFNSRMIEQYQTERLQKGKKVVKRGDTFVEVANKPGTINRHTAMIKHMFTKAVEWELVEPDALKKIRRVKQLKENNKRLRYLSTDECESLIKECSNHLKPIVIMALNTGMRRGEILNLKWDNIDLKHGFILLDITKNGERREIPLNGTLKNLLEELKKGNKGNVQKLYEGNNDNVTAYPLSSPYVFNDSITGKPYSDIKTSFNSACKRAGIKDFHFHDLRHTFASHLVMAGIDLTTVSRLLGHKDLTMTLRYSHLSPKHMTKAVDVLDNILTGKNVNYTKTIQSGEF